jgi:deoxyribodipyrimidine photo-lyase
VPAFNEARLRPANDRPPAPDRDYVLYWMQAYRRLNRNHALDHALHLATTWAKPLVVYEGLRLDYPWASARHHRFMLDGMRANARRAKRLGINYWPFVESPDRPARGLLRRLAQRACAVVTDDYPAFVVPGQTAALATKIDVPLIAMDGNGLVPLSLLGPAVSAAAHLRLRLHRLFAEAWANRADAEPKFPKAVRMAVDPAFEPWDADGDLDSFIAGLPIDQTVKPVPDVSGGTPAAHKVLRTFLAKKLAHYGDGRNAPGDPDKTAASRLSPHLRHGHISIQECVEGVLGDDWEPAILNEARRGKREGYFHRDPNANAFLDEAVTWRDVGYHWHFCRNAERGTRNAERKTVDGESITTYFDLESTLPAWAMQSLRKHTKDPRSHTYALAEFEAATTHDPLWNAAQTELVRTGRIHNYLRMLWGKKVLEWSPTPEHAYAVLEHLNNKYAIDGRDPNSYTGILWCFGLFDRPWAPERPVFGVVRYMSSENTARKFDLDGYYRYVERISG